MDKNEPVVVTAAFRPLPGHREQVMDALRTAIPRVHEEPGCELYAIVAASDDDILMLEKWTRVADLDIHSEGEAVADLKQAIEGHLREPIDVAWYSPIPLGHADKGQL